MRCSFFAVCFSLARAFHYFVCDLPPIRCVFRLMCAGGSAPLPTQGRCAAPWSVWWWKGGTQRTYRISRDHGEGGGTRSCGVSAPSSSAADRSPTTLARRRFFFGLGACASVCAPAHVSAGAQHLRHLPLLQAATSPTPIHPSMCVCSSTFFLSLVRFVRVSAGEIAGVGAYGAWGGPSPSPLPSLPRRCTPLASLVHVCVCVCVVVVVCTGASPLLVSHLRRYSFSSLRPFFVFCVLARLASLSLPWWGCGYVRVSVALPLLRTLSALCVCMLSRRHTPPKLCSISFAGATNMSQGGRKSDDARRLYRLQAQ